MSGIFKNTQKILSVLDDVNESSNQNRLNRKLVHSYITHVFRLDFYFPYIFLLKLLTRTEIILVSHENGKVY